GRAALRRQGLSGPDVAPAKTVVKVVQGAGQYVHVFQGACDVSEHGSVNRRDAAVIAPPAAGSASKRNGRLHCQGAEVGQNGLGDQRVETDRAIGGEWV